ncbi:MAG: DNA polymerase III subunit [Verrucomicrobia bacterium]|nr:DNA polymerase III subunit [Verrucomicrobiota bacterium]
MSFVQFPEQQQIVQVLQRSLERNRLAHGYLFTGNELRELESMALTLAKTINCQSPVLGANGVAIDSCDQCDSCRRMEDENHPDMNWVRPESKSRVITIDQIRSLLQTVNLKPTMSPYKVGVLVCADRLNIQAANAFLKTLEEPPASSILILLTTEPQRLLETILSRCLRLNFSGERKISPEEKTWVASFAQMAGEAKGGLLGRYRLLGVLLGKLSESRETIEKTLTARSPLSRYDDMDQKLRDKLESELTAAVEAEYRRQRADLLVSLQLWLRDVWLQTVSQTDTWLSFPELQELSQKVAQRIQAPEAIENLQILEQTQRRLGTNVQEALALEVGFLKLKL